MSSCRSQYVVNGNLVASRSLIPAKSTSSSKCTFSDVDSKVTSSTPSQYEHLQTQDAVPSLWEYRASTAR